MHRLGIDLDQHLRIDETADCDHCRSGSDGAEDFAMRASHGLPVARDVHDVDTGANDVLELAPAGSALSMF